MARRSDPSTRSHRGTPGLALAQDFVCGLPLGCASFTPANRLKDQILRLALTAARRASRSLRISPAGPLSAAPRSRPQIGSKIRSFDSLSPRHAEPRARSGFRLQALSRLRLVHAPQSPQTSDPSTPSLPTTPSLALAQDFACRLPLRCASFPPPNRL